MFENQILYQYKKILSFMIINILATTVYNQYGKKNSLRSRNAQRIRYNRDGPSMVIIYGDTT